MLTSSALVSVPSRLKDSQSSSLVHRPSTSCLVVKFTPLTYSLVVLRSCTGTVSHTRLPMMTSRVSPRSSSGCHTYPTRRAAPSRSSHLPTTGTATSPTTHLASQPTMLGISSPERRTRMVSSLVSSIAVPSLRLLVVGLRLLSSVVLASVASLSVSLALRPAQLRTSPLLIPPTPTPLSKSHPKLAVCGTPTMLSRLHRLSRISTTVSNCR